MTTANGETVPSPRETTGNMETLSLSLERDTGGSWRVAWKIRGQLVHSDRHLSGEKALTAAIKASETLGLNELLRALDLEAPRTEMLHSVGRQAQWRVQHERNAPKLEPLVIGVIHDVPGRMLRIFAVDDPTSRRRDWRPPVAVTDIAGLLTNLDDARDLGGIPSEQLLQKIRDCPSSRPAQDPDGYMRGRMTRQVPLRNLGYISCAAPEASHAIARAADTNGLVDRLQAIELLDFAGLALPLDPEVLSTADDLDRDGWEIVQRTNPRLLRKIHDHTRYLRDRLSADLGTVSDEAQLVRIDELEFARRIAADAAGARLGADRESDGQP